ncbi:hypothetical protein AB0G05_19995 [Nonomuraea wenchangensis]
MAQFRDLDEFFDDSLSLPIGGKTYRVPPADAETGLFCQRLMAAGIDAANGKQVDAANLDDDGETDLYRRVLGGAYDEMIADRVSWPRIKHAGVTAFLWIAGDADTAAKYWEAGPEAEAPEAEAASSTPSRGSTSGTSRTPRTRAATAKRSGGKTS